MNRGQTGNEGDHQFGIEKTARSRLFAARYANSLVLTMKYSVNISFTCHEVALVVLLRRLLPLDQKRI